jgi:Transglutaminase-like superfamily
VRDRWHDLSLAVRMLGWRLAIRQAKALLPLPRLVRLISRQPAWRPRRAAGDARIVALSARLCRGRLRDATCLERSLLAYRFLAEAGASPRLTVAVRPNGKSLEWHAWVTPDGGQPVHETEASLHGYLPVVVFDAQGRIEWTDSTAEPVAGLKL